MAKEEHEAGAPNWSSRLIPVGPAGQRGVFGRLRRGRLHSIIGVPYLQRAVAVGVGGGRVCMLGSRISREQPTDVVLTPTARRA